MNNGTTIIAVVIVLIITKDLLHAIVKKKIALEHNKQNLTITKANIHKFKTFENSFKFLSSNFGIQMSEETKLLSQVSGCRKDSFKHGNNSKFQMKQVGARKHMFISYEANLHNNVLDPLIFTRSEVDDTNTRIPNLALTNFASQPRHLVTLARIQLIRA